MHMQPSAHCDRCRRTIPDPPAHGCVLYQWPPGARAIACASVALCERCAVALRIFLRAPAPPPG
jgi:hypothetical protein